MPVSAVCAPSLESSPPSRPEERPRGIHAAMAAESLTVIGVGLVGLPPEFDPRTLPPVRFVEPEATTPEPLPS